MEPTQLITKILQCMYLKQQAINTAEHGLVHEVMTHCEIREACGPGTCTTSVLSWSNVVQVCHHTLEYI